MFQTVAFIHSAVVDVEIDIDIEIDHLSRRRVVETILLNVPPHVPSERRTSLRLPLLMSFFFTIDRCNHTEIQFVLMFRLPRC